MCSISMIREILLNCDILQVSVLARNVEAIVKKSKSEMGNGTLSRRECEMRVTGGASYASEGASSASAYATRSQRVQDMYQMCTDQGRVRHMHH